MRTQLTTFFKVINETVQQRDSRIAVTTLLDQASSVMKASNALNDELELNLANNEDYQKQFQKQLNYERSLAETKEIEDEYLRERMGEATSVISNQIHQQVVTPSRTPSTHVSSQHSHNSHIVVPDYQLSVLDWIEDYTAGRRAGEPITREAGCKTSVKTDLGPYSGSALEWFAWIDLFKSIVHDSNCSPGEKLAILRRNLQGDCQDIVYGLGGGEPTYKEA